jgi:hypothetical protein
MRSPKNCNKTFFIALLTYLSLTVNAQNTEKDYYRFDVDTIDLSSTEKINSQKEFLINCMNYYLSQKIGYPSQEEMNCFNVFLKLSRNNDFNTGLVKYYPRKLIRGMNMAYSSVYWVGQTKLKLENPYLMGNDSLLVSKSVELFLDYCFYKNNRVHLSKERKRVQKLREEGKLDLYINELIVEREKKK